MKPRFSLRISMSASLVAAVLLTSVLLGSITFTLWRAYLRDDLATRLHGLVATAALIIDPAIHNSLRKPEDMQTPGYQARDMDFRTALQQATGQIPVKGALATTERAHIPLTRSAREEPNLTYAAPAMTNLDSNTVDMDRERASFADNAVKYEASLRFLNGSIRTMLDAIKGQS